MKSCACCKLQTSSIALLLTLSLLLFPGMQLHAEEYGVITDVSGESVIIRGDGKVKADLGTGLNSGDIIELEEQSSLAIVSYESCREWLLTGSDRITIDHVRGPVSGKSRLNPSRTLPVCYSPEEYQDENLPVIGGFVLRGEPKDPVAGLRKEFEQGKASNTVLMTLIMHDLSRGEQERARPYYLQLKERIPDSSFVKSIAPRFERP